MAYGSSLTLPSSPVVPSDAEPVGNNNVLYMNRECLKQEEELLPKGEVENSISSEDIPDKNGSTDMENNNLEVPCSEDAAHVNLVDLAPEPLFSIPVQIGHASYKALVDTGASHCLIQESCMEGLAVERIPQENCTLVGLGGVAITSLYAVEVTLTIQSLQFKVGFLVMPSRSIKHSLILGTDFFSQYRVTVDVSHHRLSSSEPGGTWDMYFKESITTICRDVPIYCLEDVTIKHTKPTLVEVQFADHLRLEGDLYFEGDFGSALGEKFGAEPGILSLGSGKASVLVFVKPDVLKDKVLKRGTKLGMVSTIVDIYPVDAQETTENSKVKTLIQEQVELGNLTEGQAKQVRDLMNRRSAAISCYEGDIGWAGVTEHYIELHDSTPLRQKPRQFPEPIAREIERQCQELVDMDILEYSRSPWSSPVVSIRKPDGTLRLCVDYRKLNQVTKADRFPVPNMNDLVFGLHENHFSLRLIS